MRADPPGGRAALVDATSAAVRRARADGTRLAVAIVESDRGAETIARDVASLAGLPTYAIGPRSLALVLPGSGRADAFGVLARIEVACGATGRAVELEPGEDAVELLARLLAAGEQVSG